MGRPFKINKLTVPARRKSTQKKETQTLRFFVSVLPLVSSSAFLLSTRGMGLRDCELDRVRGGLKRGTASVSAALTKGVRLRERRNTEGGKSDPGVFGDEGGDIDFEEEVGDGGTKISGESADGEGSSGIACCFISVAG